MNLKLIVANNNSKSLYFMTKITQYNNESIWNDFINNYNLSEDQTIKFMQYYKLLIEANKLYNITTITDEKSVILDHFQDSLQLTKIMGLHNKYLADVGAGGGFPTIPLKILDPSIKLVLIEVNLKKVAFLQSIIDNLKLENVSICDYDWRTFIRKTDYPLDIFCARASLQPDELIRMFKPSSPYKNCLLVYWASKYWEPGNEKIFIKSQIDYTIANKHRKLIFFIKGQINE